MFSPMQHLVHLNQNQVCFVCAGENTAINIAVGSEPKCCGFFFFCKQHVILHPRDRANMLPKYDVFFISGSK